MTAVRRPRIDPRFRQRRIEVAREEGRRRLRTLVIVASVLVAGLMGLVALESPLLAVRHVRVVGAAHTDDSAILAAGSLAGHPNMIDVHAGASAARIERLPWIDRAHVARHWPATVVVTVTERVAVASVQGQLVDKTGRVLGPVGTAAVPPLLVDTPAGTTAGPAPPPPGRTVDPVFAPALLVAAAIPSPLVPRVTGVVVGSDGSVGLHLGPASARLGSPDDALAEKLQAVQTMLDKVTVGTAIIDVTVASAPEMIGG